MNRTHASRIVLTAAVALASGVLLAGAAEKLKFPWAPAALNADAGLTKIEADCLAAGYDLDVKPLVYTETRDRKRVDVLRVKKFRLIPEPDALNIVMEIEPINGADVNPNQLKSIAELLATQWFNADASRRTYKLMRYRRTLTVNGRRVYTDMGPVPR